MPPSKPRQMPLTFEPLRCHKCGHRWLQRQLAPPLRCPICGSRHWHEPSLNMPDNNEPPTTDAAHLAALDAPGKEPGR